MSSPFFVPLYRRKISNDSLQIIKQDVSSFIQNNQDKFKTPWRCDTLTTINYPIKENINSTTLFNEIKISTEEYIEQWGFENPLPLENHCTWVNISPPNQFQEVHNHLSPTEKNLFSGVIYIESTPNSGNLILCNPLEKLIATHPHAKSLPTVIEVEPEEGVMICFPAWLDHFVNPNKTNQNRISVSWNIKLNK